MKATDYLHDGEYRLDYALRKAGELPEPNKGYLLEYVRTLKLRGRKARTMARRIHEIKYVLTLLGKDAKAATRRDIEDLILKLNESSMASTSRGITKLSLKNFFRFLFNSEDDPDTYPPLVRWVKVDKGNKGGKVPDDLLTAEEMQMLIGACKTNRDKAIIAILSTFGCRIGELLNLHYKDVILSETDVSWISFTGKTGYRKVPFGSNSLCWPYIVAYLNEYKPKSPDAPLFMTKEGRAVDYKNVRRLLVHLKDWTGFKRRLHPHLFRFSAATSLSGVLTESLLKRYMGWTMDSKVTAVYIKHRDKDLADGVMRATGSATAEPEKPKPQVRLCPKCKKNRAITDRFCECGACLDNDKILADVIDIVGQQQTINRQQTTIDHLQRDVKDLRLILDRLDKFLPTETTKTFLEVDIPKMRKK